MKVLPFGFQIFVLCHNAILLPGLLLLSTLSLIQTPTHTTKTFSRRQGVLKSRSASNVPELEAVEVNISYNFKKFYCFCPKGS